MKYRLAKKKIKASAIVRLWIQSCHQSETAWREAQHRRDRCSEKILAFYVRFDWYNAHKEAVKLGLTNRELNMYDWKTYQKDRLVKCYHRVVTERKTTTLERLGSFTGKDGSEYTLYRNLGEKTEIIK